MIYHICPHFDSFIKTAIDRFESIKPGFNRCIELYDKVPSATKMKIQEAGGYVYKSCSYNNPEWTYDLLSDCTGIIIHNLRDYMLNPLLSLPYQKKIYFRSYGGDIFDLIYDADQNFYFPRTKVIMGNILPLKPRLMHAMNNIYCNLVPHKRNWEKTREKKILLLSKLFAIGTSCPYEFEMIITRLPEIKLKYLRFGNFPLTDVENCRDNVPKENIMIGHSNSPGQNHVDAFELIGRFRLKGCIITPLSYVNSKYTKEVIRKGDQFFKDKFKPLLTFIPKDEYFNILSSCYAFIELSIFQQGLGNIMYMLKQGSNVYLPKENPFYIYSKQVGITIFSVEDDLYEDHLNNHRLTQTEIDMNNSILDSFYSPEIDNETARTIIHHFR